MKFIYRNKSGIETHGNPRGNRAILFFDIFVTLPTATESKDVH